MAFRRSTASMVRIIFTGIFLITYHAFSFSPFNASSPADPVTANAADSPVTSQYSAGLVSFTGRVNHGVVTLKWQTVDETNCKGFDIEMKTGVMGTFTKIAFFEGKGAPNEAHSYQFFDIQTIPERYSYRLREICTNGQSAYSNDVSVVVPIENDRSAHK